MILRANCLNPAEFFGACGFFELAALQHPGLQARWVDDGLELVDLADEQGQAILEDFSSAGFVPDANWDDGNSTQPFSLVMQSQSIYMDWWERRDGSGNSMWKCFGGKQRSLDVEKLLLAAAALVDEGVAAADCLQASTPLSGRLGFDPRSAWTSIDTGFSPNDLGDRYSVIPTFPFSELMTAVTAQCWPGRFVRGDGCYVSWTSPLPVAVARVLPASHGTEYTFSRIKRGQGISAFTFSRIAVQQGDN